MIARDDMKDKKAFHSICRWTFHSGKGGFTPSDIRPQWDSTNLDTVGVIRLIKKKIAPRVFVPARNIQGRGSDTKNCDDRL